MCHVYQMYGIFYECVSIEARLVCVSIEARLVCVSIEARLVLRPG